MALADINDSSGMLTFTEGVLTFNDMDAFEEVFTSAEASVPISASNDANALRSSFTSASDAANAACRSRSEELRVGKECRSRWSP